MARCITLLLPLPFLVSNHPTRPEGFKERAWKRPIAEALRSGMSST